MLDAIAAAGYEGVEITWQMLGPWLDRPDKARRAFDARGLALAAVAMSPTSGWTDDSLIPEEEALVGRVLRFLAAFPSPRIGFGGGRLIGGLAFPEDVVPPPSAADPARSAAFDRMLARYRLTAERAASRGVSAHIHPTSTVDSLIRVQADYDRLADGLADALAAGLLQLGPDTAHVVRGDESPARYVERYAAHIGHIHLKDAGARGGPFMPLGAGDAEISTVVERLRTAGYGGWVVAEEESESAADDPATAVRAARAYLRSIGV
ncbi:MAG: sugar phosphate isomerase/epimerase [Chloroflexi bacterium]|nr:sugar phosphate isomerase/epimerase [Chloroflexota bacterium]